MFTSICIYIWKLFNMQMYFSLLLLTLKCTPLARQMYPTLGTLVLTVIKLLRAFFAVLPS